MAAAWDEGYAHYRVKGAGDRAEHDAWVVMLIYRAWYQTDKVC